MSQAAGDQRRSRIVLVVGLDLSDVSEHLLLTARDLVRSVDEAELHLVHVVPRESVTQRLAEPMRSTGTIVRANAEVARSELERLCDSIALGPPTRVALHTPVGHTAEQLSRIATQVQANVIVVEAHHAGSQWGLHRSVVARITKVAPCSVLAVRRRSTAPPPVQPRDEWSYWPRGHHAGEAQMRHGA